MATIPTIKTLVPLLSGLTLLGCAQVPQKTTPPIAQPEPPKAQAVAPVAVPEPVVIAPAPVVTPPPAASTKGVLLGRSYHRAYISPRVVFNGWAVQQKVNLGADSGRDFFLLAKVNRRIAVLADKGANIGGVTYKYTVSQEVPVPDEYKTAPALACKLPPEQDRDVLALMSPDETARAAWALQPDDVGHLRQLDASELGNLRCTKPAVARKPAAKPSKKKHHKRR
ncbi:hypothetical protein [Chitinimonas naiadis]